MKNLEVSHAEHIGQAIVKLLALELDSSDRVDTSIGTKTSVGLARTMLRLMNEPNFCNDVIKG